MIALIGWSLLMKLSACIVTYNNEATIEKAIASVLAYGKPANLHLYVVDNGSTDRTLKSSVAFRKLHSNKLERIWGSGQRIMLCDLSLTLRYIL